MKNKILFSLTCVLALSGAGCPHGGPDWSAEDFEAYELAYEEELYREYDKDISFDHERFYTTYDLNCPEHEQFGYPWHVNAFRNHCGDGVMIFRRNLAPTAKYVMYELSVIDAINTVEFDEKYEFTLDPDMDPESFNNIDHYQSRVDGYKNAGYVMVRMKPWDDASLLSEALETNYSTNTAPMKPELYNGLWKTLEQSIRDYVINNGVDVHITTGTIEATPIDYTSSNYLLPIGFFKVIYDRSSDKATAYLFYQDSDMSLPLSDYAVSIDTLEGLAELNFFYTLSTSETEALESEVVLFL